MKRAAGRRRDSAHDRWEGFAIENLIPSAGPNRTPYYFRTEDGAEIDLLFERGVVVELAIEVKRSTAPVLSRGFRLAADALNAESRFLVHEGDATWTVDGVSFVPLEVLMKQLAAEALVATSPSA